MAHLLSAEQRIRIRQFDTAIESTLIVLGDPKVRKGLGAAVLTLTRNTENLFLPNIRHGVASLPPSMLLTNRYALLPYLAEEINSPLKLDYGMLAPTKRRFDHMCTSFSKTSGVSNAQAQDIMLAKTAELQRLSNVRASKLTKHQGKLSALTVTHHIGPWTLDYETRPTLLLRPDRIGFNPYETAGTVVHELTHAEDHEGLQTPQGDNPDRNFRAFTEFHAYQAGWAVYDAGSLLRVQDKTADVENLRREYATPENPYPVTAEIVDRLSAIIDLG